MLAWMLVVGALITSQFIIQHAYAQSCIELATCSMDIDDPIGFISMPLFMTFGDAMYLLIWGMVIGFIWIRTGNSLYAGFVGIVIAGSMTSLSQLQQSLSQYFYMAIILLVCSLGLTLYSVWRRGETG